MKRNLHNGLVRRLAILAAIQYFSEDLDEIEITWSTIHDIYGLKRYSQERVDEMESIFKELFSHCKVIYYTGRAGMPGFGGFILKWRPTNRRGKKRKKSELVLKVPKFGLREISDILDYNLLLAQSADSPWKRGHKNHK